MHVCLITPAHLSTNPRLVKEALALSGFGHQVTIVCCRFMQWPDAADREFDNQPWRVLRIAYGPPSALSARVFRAVRMRLCRKIVRAVGPRQGLAERALHWVVPELTRAACGVRADLYVAHNLAALPAAHAAARRNAASLGFDAEDFHLGELNDTSSNALMRSVVRSVEARYLPDCDYVTAASPGIARAYSREYGIDLPQVVLNVFPLADAPPEPSSKGSAATPTLYWFSQTIGPDRGLENVIAAVATSRTKPALFLRGQPMPGYDRCLSQLARLHGVADRIHYLPPAGPSEMPRLASKFDVGLAPEVASNANRNVCLTNKLFTYLLAGIPVLASATAGQREMAHALPGAMFTYDASSPVDLGRVIDELFSSPQALAAARRTAWQYGQSRFNWEWEQQVLLRQMAAATDKAGFSRLSDSPPFGALRSRRTE